MNPQTLQEALAEYRDSRAKRKQIPTVDEIAEKHGTTRQMLLYHANKQGPGSEPTRANDETPEDVHSDATSSDLSTSSHNKSSEER